ncbi:MAG: hypothetical protein H6816_09450 [Phycisphaerales bacterium]|nr:hypothetical protein [Phycisphaerales bacterium]
MNLTKRFAPVAAAALLTLCAPRPGLGQPSEAPPTAETDPQAATPMPGQADAAEPDAPPSQPELQIDELGPKVTTTPEPGVWPTPDLIDALVRRVAADVAGEYDLDSTQAQRVEDRMVERWTRFMTQNRRDLEPLITDYLEARFAIHPPSADRVAEWAARAMPVYNRLRQNVEAGEDDVRSVLDDDQRAAFDRAAPQRQTQLDAVAGQLKRWSVGKFDEAEWWVPPASNTPPAPRGAQAEQASPPPTPEASTDLPPRLVGEFNAWEKYVQDFCDRLELDRAQRNAAGSILRELIARATDHARRHRDRIAALEEKIASGSGEEDETFNRDLVELYGPIDRMFAELVARLERLPTAGQKHRAEQAAEQPAEPAETP